MSQKTTSTVRDLFRTRAPTLAPGPNKTKQILDRLIADDTENFAVTARRMPRTKHSIPALAILAYSMMRDAVDAGEIGFDEVYIIFLVILFVFVIDDHLDIELNPKTTPVTELRAYLDELVVTCRERRQAPHDPIIRFVAELTERLREYEAFETYEALYFRCLEAMLDGMLKEFALRDPHRTSLDDYMQYAAPSVGVTVGLVVTLIVRGDVSYAEREREIDTLFDIVSSIIRYANDISSYKRELAENKFSSILLAAHKFGIHPDHIEKRVVKEDIHRIIRALIVTEAFDLYDCLAYVDPQAGYFHGVIVNTVTSVLHIYETADIHEFVLPRERAADP